MGLAAEKVPVAQDVPRANAQGVDIRAWAVHAQAVRPKGEDLGVLLGRARVVQPCGGPRCARFASLNIFLCEGRQRTPR